MKLIAGLGNIGKEYSKSRHNVGFVVLDEFAKKHSLDWSNKSKLKSEVVQLPTTNYKLPILLAKPSTMMNNSGEAVRAISSFYKLKQEDILLIYDDKDLDMGTIRIRQGGGDSGHNGVKSVISHIGSDFWRLRIGIANDLLNRQDTSDFVLGNFNKKEQEILPTVIRQANLKIEEFIKGNLQHNTLK